MARWLSPETFAAVAEERLGSGSRPCREEDLRYFVQRVGPETIAEAIESQPPEERSRLIDALLDRLDPVDVLLG